MIGAIAGDIIGSVFEIWEHKSKRFPLYDFLGMKSTFTDDTVMTCAVALSLLTGRTYRDSMQALGRRHPNRGYGEKFRQWLDSPDPQPYNSMGNGSAMRVSPVGWAFSTAEEVLQEARKTAEVSHNHPEGIKGAQATALAVFLARIGRSKARIRQEIAQRFEFDLDRSVAEIRPHYRSDATCPKTVPEALIAFFESNSYEDAIRNAISLGGDSDTLACITGAVAEAHYGPVPAEMIAETRSRLTEDLLAIVDAFGKKYQHPGRS